MKLNITTNNRDLQEERELSQTLAWSRLADTWQPPVWAPSCPADSSCFQSPLRTDCRRDWCGGPCWGRAHTGRASPSWSRTANTWHCPGTVAGAAGGCCCGWAERTMSTRAAQTVCQSLDLNNNVVHVVVHLLWGFFKNCRAIFIHLPSLSNEILKIVLKKTVPHSQLIFGLQ